MQPQYAKAGVLVLLFLALAGASVRAEEGEFYVNTYRSIGTVSPRGVRGAAMGRTGAGLADGVHSLGINPAALGAFSGKAVDVALGFDWLDDGSDGTTQTTFKLGGAANLSEWSGCPRGPNQAVGGLIYHEGFSGASVNDMTRKQTSALAGYGLHVMDNLLGGVSVALYDGKWSGDEIPLGSATPVYPAYDRKFRGGEFKIGGLYRVQDETTYGLVGGYSMGTFKERGLYNTDTGSGTLERFSINGGVAHQLRDETLVLGDIWYNRIKTELPADILNERANSWGVGVGIEQQVCPDLLALRGGVYYDHTSYSSTGAGANPVIMVPGGSFSKGRFGLTAGVGVKLYNWDLGYALDVKTNGDVKNVVDVSTQW